MQERMRRSPTIWRKVIFSLPASLPSAGAAAGAGLTLDREGNWLIIRGARIPGDEVRVNYLEAYCRAGSTEADWVEHTVIPHTNELISLSADKKVLRLRDTLADGLIVEHTITAGDDEVDLRLVARNPTAHRSEAHWAQPCVRLGAFTGFSNDLSRGDLNDYLPKCFIFLEWATGADADAGLGDTGPLHSGPGLVRAGRAAQRP